MRKFIMKKKAPTPSPGTSLLSPTPELATSTLPRALPTASRSAVPTTSYGNYSQDESNDGRTAQRILHPDNPDKDIDVPLLVLENKKLKDATQKLISENLKLKEEISQLQNTKREYASREPSWNETKQLIQMLAQENDYLIKHIRTEQNHLRDLKTLQLNEIQQLSEQLDACQMQKRMVEQKFQVIRLEHDKLQADVKMMTEDMSQVVPLEDHQESVRRCQMMLNDLRALYHKELATLNEDADASHSQLRAVCLEVAKLGTELEEARRRNDLLRKECTHLRTSQAALQTELSAAVQHKVQAEHTLRELLGVFEKKSM